MDCVTQSTEGLMKNLEPEYLTFCKNLKVEPSQKLYKFYQAEQERKEKERLEFEKERKEMILREKKRARGGYRKGAGRKAIRGKTTPIRIPDIYRDAVLELIHYLDKPILKRNKSKPVTIKLISEKKIELNFVVKSLD